MKKVCRNIFAAIAAVALVSSFASCSDGSSDDEVENPKPEDGTSVAGEEITFVAVADSTNSEDTVLFVKYDRSAKGADELIKISNAELKISVNGNVTKTYNSITFALDEYGASFSGKKGLLTDKADMKEYKTKLSVGAQVKKGDTVKVVLTKGSVSGAGKDKVDLTGVVVALIDKAEKVSYYKELAENEYLPLIKVEDKKIEDKKPEEKKEEVKPEEEKKSEAEKKPEESQEQKPAEKTDEQKTAEGSEGQNTQPAEGNSENGAGGESQTEDTLSTWIFPVTDASTDNDNTVLLIKYNRSAAGADELISISDAELKVWKNDTLIKTFDSISFALDNYGASFDDSDKNPIKNASNMKEYKVKLPIETTVASGDNVKVEFTKGTISGAGKDKVKAGEDIVVALVDIAPTAGYYKELCANTNEYKAIFGKATVSTAAATPAPAPAATTTNYKAYTLTTSKAVKKDDVGLTFQYFAGEDEEPATITLTNLKVSVKIGDADAVEKTFDSVKIEHHSWDGNAKESNARVNLGLGSETEEIASGTTVVLKVLSATVSDTSKASSINFSLQQDGKHNAYDMLTAADSKAFVTE